MCCDYELTVLIHHIGSLKFFFCLEWPVFTSTDNKLLVWVDQTEVELFSPVIDQPDISVLAVSFCRLKAKQSSTPLPFWTNKSMQTMLKVIKQVAFSPNVKDCTLLMLDDSAYFMNS